MHARQRRRTGQDPTAQRLQAHRLRLALGDGQLHRQRQGPRADDVLRARPDAALLPAAARGRRQRHLAAHHQRPGAHRGPELVTRQRHGVQAPPAHVHVHPPHRRHRVGVDRHPAGIAGAGRTGAPAHRGDEPGHVLDEPGLVVRRHDAHQRRAPRLHRPPRVPGRHPARGIDVQEGQLRPQGPGAAGRVEHGRVLDGGDDQVRALDPRRPGRQHPPDDDEAVRLGAPAGEEDLVGVDAQGGGQARPGLAERGARAAPGGVQGGGVGPARRGPGEVPGDLGGHLGAHRRAGRVVEVAACRGLGGGHGRFVLVRVGVRVGAPGYRRCALRRRAALGWGA